VSSHRRLIAFLLSPLTLSLVRRFAPIAVGAAVAYVLLLPSAAAWLRKPAQIPLPNPLILDGPGESGRPDAYALADRVHSKLRSRSRSADGFRVRQRPGPATYRARPVELAPIPARGVVFRPVEGDDDDVDDRGDERGDD
jgi:hypothetical protein